jgi:hypothetical protein
VSAETRTGHLSSRGVNGKIEGLEERNVSRCEVGSSGSGQELIATSCEHDYELSGSVKSTEVFGQLSYCQFLKYESVLGSWLNVDGLNTNCVLC